VESALTLPLVLFMALGTVQLFMMMQGRAMAQYAVARSTRAGSLKFGDCTAMMHTAVAALLPTFAKVSTPELLAAGFEKRKDGHFSSNDDQGRTETIVWIVREQPSPTGEEEESFDLPSATPSTLAVRMVFWYPLKIPFADVVWTRILLGYFALRTRGGVNPLNPAQSTTDWNEGKNLDSLAAGELQLASELQRRAGAGHYSAPIQVTYTMKMMSPPRKANFRTKVCTPYP
jgi:hypothetical protein